MPGAQVIVNLKTRLANDIAKRKYVMLVRTDFHVRFLSFVFDLNFFFVPFVLFVPYVALLVAKFFLIACGRMVLL